MKAKLIKEN